MIIGYCRVSTTKDEQDASIEGQKEELYRYGCDKVFAEKRSSFRKKRRPEWERFKAAIESGIVSKAVLINLQRTSRSCEAESFFDRCRELKVEVEVLDGTNIDTNDPGGFVMVRTYETINQLESMMKAKAVEAGRRRRRAAGATAVGRCPFGYHYDGTGPVPDPEQWEDAKQLWADLEKLEFSANRYIRSSQMPDPYDGQPTSAPGLYRWIKNKMLIGIVEYPDMPMQKTTPLVSEKAWLNAQRLLDRRQFHSVRRSEKTTYLLTELCFCKKCNHIMTPTIVKGKVRMKHGHPNCEYWGRGLAEWKIKNQLLETLRAAALSDAATQPPKAPVVDAKKQMQLSKMLQLKAEGVPGLDEAIAGLRRELQRIGDGTQASANWSGYRDLFSRPNALETMPDEELRAVLLEFVDQIFYIGDPDRVEIRLRDEPGSMAA